MTIFFDENISQYYAHAFNSFETTENPRVEVLSTFDVFGGGEQDPDLIPEIAKAKGILMTRDGDFKKIQLYAPLVKHFG